MVELGGLVQRVFQEPKIASILSPYHVGGRQVVLLLLSTPSHKVYPMWIRCIRCGEGNHGQGDRLGIAAGPSGAASDPATAPGSLHAG